MVTSSRVPLAYCRAAQAWPRGLVVVIGDLEAEAFARGLSLTEVAALTGFTKQAVFRAARGEAIQLRTLRKILAVLERTRPLIAGNGEAR